jgi:hypothetical protein
MEGSEVGNQQDTTKDKEATDNVANPTESLEEIIRQKKEKDTTKGNGGSCSNSSFSVQLSDLSF